VLPARRQWPCLNSSFVVQVFFTPSIPPQQVREMNEHKRKRVAKLQDEFKKKFSSAIEARLSFFRINKIVSQAFL